MRLRAFVVLSLALAACDSRPVPTAPAPAPTASAAPASERATYVEVLTGGAALDEPLPLIVGLHGLGDRPERFIGLLASLDRKARVVAMRGLDPYGDGGFSWFPFTGKVGDPAAVPGIRRSVDAIARAVEDLGRAHPQRGKAIVVGFSQGGVLSYALATHRGALFSAAFPVGGFLHEGLRADADANAAPPIEAFHGEADRLVTLDLATGTREALGARGIGVILHTYPGVGHGVPDVVRAELFEALRGAVDRASATP